MFLDRHGRLALCAPVARFALSRAFYPASDPTVDEGGSHMRQLLFVLALTAFLAGAGTAIAKPALPTMLQDDKVLVSGSQSQRDARLDELKSLGVDIVKVRVSWRSVAPSGDSRTKPSFNATDPAAYPASGWAPYDAVVRGANARGMGV